MDASIQMAGFASVLEADLRQLAHDARRSEGFASFFSNADNQPDVKEAADRAVMKVRSLADHHDMLNQIKSCKVCLILIFFLREPKYHVWNLVFSKLHHLIFSTIA